jgi:fatty-acyl-CoA synthase
MYTGDPAVIDAARYLNIFGRKGRGIRGGENICPTEVEQFLYNRPGIVDVQVDRRPGDRYGEEVVA